MEKPSVPPIPEEDTKSCKFPRGVLVALAVFCLAGAALFVVRRVPGTSTPSLPSVSNSQAAALEKFSSVEEFKSYLEEAEAGGYFGGIGLMRGGLQNEITTFDAALAPKGMGLPEAAGGGLERVSETTVQVKGIDEPDIVKTDGEEIYFSSEFYGGIRPLEPRPLLDLEQRSVPGVGVVSDTRATKVIKAFPPADLTTEAKIERTGNLLLVGDILVVFSGDTAYGYDVSDPENPEEKWDLELESNNQIAAARLYQGKVYLVTKTQIDTYRPCPIRPFIGGASLEIRCVDIYHPATNVPVDVTYTAMRLDPARGEVEQHVSFVGSSNSSVIYMSPEAIYATYSYRGDFVGFFYDFLESKCEDLIPSSVVEKLAKLQGYDISDASKINELQTILEQYQSSLSDDERLRVENELTNRMQDYLAEHKRELEKTGVAKIGLGEFEVLATGVVPGRPLNQFSLDEYQGHLRIATTIGDNMFGQTESANDVYVLDEDLKVVGSVTDLGLTERIYSARFIEDKGYVVTFRQIDPFYVLDLSDPKKPELKGELKIPGYSSYLHPITKDKILGIGKEGSKVKLSLFDVRSPASPVEADKYLLEEGWSDILNTHHAFLLDAKHRVFFLPGSRGGYIFSYENDKLKLEKAVSDIRARRAIYINDYLYIIGDDKLVVLSETDWTQVNRLLF